ncbi:hypothetical protein L0Y81_29855 (plasmid) [Burkholderia multivorans]|uniref:hypothetical protein n=2 Tax=Burkholderia multivorans TaxID=87883 RepID=UPI0011B1FEE1|nr:hypothetical protein [Burkholderia multivorans]ELK7722801.1 hypothetical protein [Burkholderia cenocepacia]MBR8049431.1 hypothetical protein [Burkholderia multivorans]UQO75832.1 hypothetical protein L0Y81_29855 [Burkholderia multivorans]
MKVIKEGSRKFKRPLPFCGSLVEHLQKEQGCRMAFLKRAAVKLLALLKRVSADDDFREDYVARARRNSAGGDPHNGFGIGSRGPNNDWGMNSRSGW